MTKEMLNPIMQDAMVMGQNSTTAPSSVATDSWNCSCGKSGITSKFCPECGSSKPVTVVGWNCSCGQTNITSKFCPDCGAKKPEIPTTWTCPNCGVGGITSKFCPDCGHKKDN